MELNKKLQAINEEYNEKIKSLEEERSNAILEAKANSYKEELNELPLGSIIELFENLSQDILTTKKGKVSINEFVKLIKEDTTLSKIYFAKDNIFKSKASALAEEAKNEIIDSTFHDLLLENKSSKELKSLKDKLSAFVNESLNNVSNFAVVYEFEKIHSEKPTMELFESIDQCVCLNPSKTKNIVDIAKHRNIICGWWEKATKKNNDYPEDPIKEERTFNQEKEECIRLIDEAWNKTEDANLRLKLTEMKSSLEKKEFSEITKENDFKFISELKKTLS